MPKLLHFSGFKNVEGILLFLGISLLPIYVFDSGGIQPAHLIFAIFSLAYLIKIGIPSELWFYLLAGMVAYFLFIESLYSILGGDPSALINGVFFLYNLILAASIYFYCLRYGLATIAIGVFIASAIAVLAVYLGGISLQESGYGRATGGFNNPNQLGYFSVCILSLSYLLYSHGYLKYIASLILYSIAIFLSISSLSKAAMIANFFVLLFALFPRTQIGDANNCVKKNLVRVVWLLVVFLLALYSVTRYFSGPLEDYLFVQRLQDITQESDSSLSSRGYFAFFEGNAIQWIFGLGSSGVVEIVGHEVHSTLASIMNSYGVFGLLIFISVLIIWIKKLTRAYGVIDMLCLVAPVMLYGITHNGTRFTAFWILFGASLAMANVKIKAKDSSQNTSSSF